MARRTPGDGPASNLLVAVPAVRLRRVAAKGPRDVPLAEMAVGPRRMVYSRVSPSSR
jgi:hypothetical protein